MKDSPDVDRNLSFYDSTAAVYDSMLSRFPGDLWVREAFQDLVTQTVPRGSLLLDFGCGTGTDAIWYAQHGHRVLAYDYSSGMMQQLRSKCAQEIERGALIPYEGSWSSFAKEAAPQGRPIAILANFAVLNCIHDLRSLFDDWAAVVDPSGWAIVSVLNLLYWKEFTRLSRWTSHQRDVRATQSERDMDTYLHSVREITSAAAPKFKIAFHASVGSLIRYSVGLHDWREPRSPAERIEHHFWRTPPLSRLGKFLFIGLRRVP
jgi:SAM-dependent methyltransferase